MMDRRVKVYLENRTAWTSEYAPRVPTARVSYGELYGSGGEENRPGEKKARVIKGDTLDVTIDLVKNEGFTKPLVLNMADKRRPGGCVEAGGGMQEESLFRRTNLHSHLIPSLYPLDKEDEALYSRGVCVFRMNEENNFLPFTPVIHVDVVSLPALSMPRTTDGGNRFYKEDAEIFAKKVDVLLGLADRNAHDVIVLGALGCGAFGCPAKHVARIFAERIEAFHERRPTHGSPICICFAVLGKNYDVFAQELR